MMFGCFESSADELAGYLMTQLVWGHVLRFRSVLGRFGLGFRWCLAVSGRLPTSFIFVFVPARLRDGCCFRTCLSSGL